jgi:catechol 2,3-dioxygenase-like lactoylglutathione lyase family enzyme
MATTQQTITKAADQNGLPSPFAALHHVAVVTNDMKKTVAFYRDVLGSEVAMGHRLDRPGHERHYFITVAPNTVFAFFEFPDAELPAYKDATLPSTGRSLDHICFHVEDDAAFDAWYTRIGEKGVDNRSEIIERGPSRSFFFSDPNNIVFEVATPGMGRRFPVLEDPDPAY